MKGHSMQKQKQAIRRVVGMMSGTSVDGIDAALVEISQSTCVKLLAFENKPFPPAVREKIFSLFRPEAATVDRVGYMNFLLGELYAEAALSVIAKAGFRPEEIDLIGSHGQTIWHAPEPSGQDGYPIRYTVQIGEGAVIMMGAIINIVLDPILIFGLFGFPKMGITGAAAATVIGQMIAAVLAVVINQTRNKEIQLSLKGFRPDGTIIGQIYAIGVPSIVMQAIGSVMNYGMNRILISFSSTATAVFGVYFKLQSFVFMPAFGLNNGVIPVMAYNYGAGSRERVVKTLRHTVTYAVCIMAVGLLIFQLFPTQLLKMFSASDTMLSLGVPALRIISLSFILAGFGISCSSIFQALGKAVYSMFVSIARQLVALLPVAYFLAQFGNVNLIWWAFPIAELISIIMTILFMFRIFRTIVNKIGEKEMV